MTDHDLSGRVALVTGASGGIGAAISRALGAAGATVAAELGQSVPIGRVGQPEEVAELVLAVLTNAFITSKVLTIDGGAYPR